MSSMFSIAFLKESELTFGGQNRTTNMLKKTLQGFWIPTKRLDKGNCSQWTTLENLIPKKSDLKLVFLICNSLGKSVMLP